MSLRIGIQSTNNAFIITLAGSFIFSAHRDFRKAREEALQSSNILIEIDMGMVEYLDSSALGMLLLLREQANASKRKVSLTNCHDLVQGVLNMANFGQLFTIR